MKIFPTSHEAKITVAILSFIFGLGLGVMASKNLGFLPELFGTLFAAFAGAYFAFKLDKRKKQEELNSENVRAANKAIFNLMRVYQAVEGYRRQFIEAHLASPLRYISIRSSLGFQSWVESFDFESLSYLFDSSNPNILMDVYELQEEVTSTIELVQERNKIYSERVEPAMKAAGINQGDDLYENDLQRILERYDIDLMKNYTDELIRCVHSIVERAERLTAEMYDLNAKAYPGHRIIRMQKVNKPMHATSA